MQGDKRLDVRPDTHVHMRMDMCTSMARSRMENRRGGFQRRGFGVESSRYRHERTGTRLPLGALTGVPSFVLIRSELHINMLSGI